MMVLDTTALWRQASEYFPPWARVTLGASAAIGEGLHQLCNALHPNVDYAVVSPWGWPIFGMFVAFPSVFLWRSIIKRLLGFTDPYEIARQYILTIEMTLKEAGMSKAEQQFQWRAVLEKLANEIQFGVKTSDPLTRAMQALDSEASSELSEATTNREPDVPA